MQEPFRVHCRKPPLFALVIGINDYKHVRKLSGAVADAIKVDEYLQRDLGVPKNRIINLRDKTATRQGFIEGFRALQRNPDIKRQDAIFIYFAGHGGETKAPSGWEAGGYKVQVILPQDTGTTSSRQITHPIPDRTIAALLNDLAREKGDNITVVFDCCHSSSGTRDDQDVPGRVARVADVEAELPVDLDQDIIANRELGRDIVIPTGFLQYGLRSHVLLAACGADQLAWETCGRGAFTTALLETLVAVSADSVTYTDLMKRLPNLPSQNPHCEGYHRDRILFHEKVSGATCIFFGIEHKNTNYVLNAGIAQGITVGSEFTVHADHVGSTSHPLCTLRVRATDAFSSTLEPVNAASHASHTLPNPAYARQIRCGPGHELRVYFSKALKRIVKADAVRHAALETGETDIGFLLTNAHTAELLVDVVQKGDSSKVAFSTTHALAREHGYDRLPHLVPATAEDISHVLCSAARWNRHVKCTNPNALGHNVHLEFTRLEKAEDKFDDEGFPIMRPMGNDMNRTGVVKMVVDPDRFFGIKIINNTRRDLYPYLFYFDVGDQSIQPHYLGPIGKGRVDPPLPAGASLTVGYGSGGEVPITFHLRDGEESDIGFFKVFLTTCQTDFDSLEQPSPFGETRVTRTKAETMKKLKSLEHWDTAMLTVVQYSNLGHQLSPKVGSSGRRRKRRFGNPVSSVLDRLRSGD